MQGLVVPPVQFQIEFYKPEKSITWIEARGIVDVAQKYISSRIDSDAGKEESATIRKAQLGDPQKFPSEILAKLVRHTSEQPQYRDYVNGPVDLASITRGGHVQWVTRKTSCAALWDQPLKNP